MASNVTVLYSQPAEGEFFNMDYYVNIHMPIAAKQWRPLGLKSWQVVKFGPDAAFYGGLLMTWEKPEDAANIVTAEASKPVFDDVPNFTNLKPILLSSSILGSWEQK